MGAGWWFLGMAGAMLGVVVLHALFPRWHGGYYLWPGDRSEPSAADREGWPRGRQWTDEDERKWWAARTGPDADADPDADEPE